MSNVGKKFKTRYQGTFTGKGAIGICKEEKTVRALGHFVLIDFGYITTWCFARELDEVVENDSN